MAATALIDLRPSVDLDRILSLARRFLGMDAVVLAEKVGDELIVRHTSGDAQSFGVAPGQVVPPIGSYTADILGDAPFTVIPDTTRHPAASHLEVTRERRIGAFAGASIALGGRYMGAISWLSHDPVPQLEAGDGRFLQLVANMVSDHLHRDGTESSLTMDKRRRVEARLQSAGQLTAYQPIVDLTSGEPAGYEALTRFADTDPATAFAEAQEVGLGVALEVKAVQAAISRLDDLPKGVFLSFNVSPAAVCSDELVELLGGVPAARLVAEITDHVIVADYDNLARGLLRLRELGLRIAVDGFGAGFASLLRVLAVVPDFIKLDTGIVRRIDQDAVRGALTSSLADFARRTDAVLVAEGVETPAERDRLVELGVRLGQGYLYAPPEPLPAPAPPRRESGRATPGRAGRTSRSSKASCPSCSRQLVEVVSRLGDRQIKLRSCSSCDLRWWEADHAPSSLTTVLDLLRESSPSRGAEKPKAQTRG